LRAPRRAERKASRRSATGSTARSGNAAIGDGSAVSTGQNLCEAVPGPRRTAFRCADQVSRIIRCKPRSDMHPMRRRSAYEYRAEAPSRAGSPPPLAARASRASWTAPNTLLPESMAAMVAFGTPTMPLIGSPHLVPLIWFPSSVPLIWSPLSVPIIQVVVMDLNSSAR
jgi:hypothetical protein